MSGDPNGPDTSDWLQYFDYQVEGDRVVLTGGMHNVSYHWRAPFDGVSDLDNFTVPSSAEVDGTIYTTIEVGPGINWYCNHLGFEQGVVFSDDCTGFISNSNTLQSIDLTNISTSNVTNMKNMFYGCRHITELDVSGFDTSNVTDMSGMFSGCYELTSLDLTGFDTSKVTSIYRMFYMCRALSDLDLSSWDLSFLQWSTSLGNGYQNTIISPAGVTENVSLGAQYMGSDGNLYSSLPRNKSRSITLTRMTRSESYDESGNPAQPGLPITSQPVDVKAKAGETVTFTVGAEGESLIYQWQYSTNGASWKNCTSAGYNTDSFSFKMKASVSGRKYRCVVSGGVVAVVSEAATITLKEGLKISSQPEDAEAAAGETVVFHVEANDPDVTYQWQYSTNGKTWKDCASVGYNTDTFSFKMKATVSGRQYRCIIKGRDETLTSDPASITLAENKFEIITQPEDVNAAAGEMVVFHVEARGTDLSYQWQYSTNGKTWKNCTSGGCNTDTFSFKMKATVSGRQYRCKVTCGTESVTSDAGTITLK